MVLKTWLSAFHYGTVIVFGVFTKMYDTKNPNLTKSTGTLVPVLAPTALNLGMYVIVFFFQRQYRSTIPKIVFSECVRSQCVIYHTSHGGVEAWYGFQSTGLKSTG